MWKEDRCDLCGECLTRCRYVNYDREKAVAEIRELTAGKPAEILKQCVTCCACNEYCPTGANPFDLISHLQETHGSLAIPEKMRHFMDAGATMPSALIPGDPGKPALSLCAMEWALPKGALEGQMFQGMTLAKGGDYFCYLGYVHIGMESPLEKNARKFVDAVAGIGCGEVVFLHADCHAMVQKAPEYGVQIPFKATHLVEYMRDYLKVHPERVSPLKRRIAYQRPCASRYSAGAEPALDELFGLIGVERVARKYDRESALCCGGLGMRLDPKRTLPFVEGNVRDALDAGAEAMVFLCPLCPGALAKPAKEKGLRPIFITELVRMALGEMPFPS